MTRQAIIAVIVGVIVVLGAAAAFLYSRVNQTPEEPTTTTAQETNEPENAMSMATITDLFTRGENLRCSFNTITDEGEANGTMYISGENARGEFDVTTQEDTLTTNVIRAGDMFYMWGDAFETGIQMEVSIDEWAQSMQNPESADPGAFDPNIQYEFNCDSWTVDSSLFTPPADIEFVSFQSMMAPAEALMEETDTNADVDNSGVGIDCSLCDSLTGDAQSICLQQCQ